MTTTPHHLFPPTAAPCPDWCTQSTGHAFDQDDGDGCSVRDHVITYGEPDAKVFVDVAQMVRWHEGVEEPVGEPNIAVYIHGDSADNRITDPQDARRLGAHLMDAADALETVQAADLSS